MAARARPVTAIRSQAAGGTWPFAVSTTHLVAVAQLGRQRHLAAVDQHADAGVADVGVDRIGEVDRRRAARQSDDAALRREAEHLIVEQLEFGVLQKFVRRANRRARFRPSCAARRRGCRAPANWPRRLECRARTARRSRVDPCRGHAPRCRIRRRRAFRACGSAVRHAGCAGRRTSCGSTDSCSASASKCSP